jgi:nicotinate-nucleotide adenylyltransferase
MIGILGGTFDPIHFGHLRPVLDIHQALGLDEVRMLPCRIPPHRNTPYATPEQRLTMLRLAVHGEQALSVDERELRRDGPSYMVDTLFSFRAEMGNERPLALLIGMDALQGLDSWHRWQELTDLCHLIVATRPGWKPPRSGKVASLVRRRQVEEVEALHVQPAGKLLFCPVTQLDISASRIRTLVAAGRSPRYLLPAAVLEYIQLAGLYQQRK